jgi:hypothetical protein
MMKKQLRKDLSHITKTISPRHDGSLHSRKHILDETESKGQA